MIIKNQCQNCGEEIGINRKICWKCNFDNVSQKVLSKENIEPIQTISRNCLQCNEPMVLIEEMEISESENLGIFKTLRHQFSNITCLYMYVCEKCRRVEFYTD